MAFGGPFSLVRFDYVSLDPGPGKQHSSLPLEQEQETEMGQVSKRCLSGPRDMALDMASGPAGLAMTGLSLGHCHMEAPLASLLEIAPGNQVPGKCLLLLWRH